MNIKLKKLKSKKNLLIIAYIIVLLIIAFSIVIISRNNHLILEEELDRVTEKKGTKKDRTNKSDKNMSASEEKEKRSEKEVKQSTSDSKKLDEDNKNSETTPSSLSNPTTNSSNSSGSQQSSSSIKNNGNFSSNQSSLILNSNTTNTDEKDWQEFINSYSTLAILGGQIDFYTASEQEVESNRWVNLGYRTELPRACIYLSSGQRCVYSLRVFAGEGACGVNKSISVNWRTKNYISDLDYLKSMGYSCP